MSQPPFKRIGTIESVDAFRAYLAELEIDLPCDDAIAKPGESPLAEPLHCGSFEIGNRFCIHPMEGWDGTRDGKPTEKTVRRWRRFGQSGAKLIWGGEAAAVQPDGRANPNQLICSNENTRALAELRETLVQAHQEAVGDCDNLVIGLQLTHSGRFARPNEKTKPEPRIAYEHPILDRKLNIEGSKAMLSDDELQQIIDRFITAARAVESAGYDFVDIKHCHGYLGHELLSAFTRRGPFGGSFENRTRFLREIVTGIRAEAPDLAIGVRLSAFDMPPFRPDPDETVGRKLGPGIPESFNDCLPYRFAFGANPDDPMQMDLRETVRFMKFLQELNITLVNLSAGSPYYNPHIQRPALYPPSDGYAPPEDPLVGVARQIHAVRQIKLACPDMTIVGSGYSYLQEYLPHVCQALVREGWVDSIGLGRMVLSYPELPIDVLTKGEMQTKLICRTFSDCTTAPRKGLVSGCYPLDPYYKKSPEMAALKAAKRDFGG